MRSRFAIGVALLLFMGALPLAQAATDRSVWEGVYNEAQAARGKAVFASACSACHADQPGQVGGHGPAPSLLGEDFAFRWLDATVADLYDVIRQTMPEAAPNSLSPEEYAALTAYILQLNAYPAGTVEIDPGAYADLQFIYIEEAPDQD